MASYDQGYNDERFEHNVSQKFHCAICLNVLKDPVMCGENRHCFCRSCITKHLENFYNCPTCQQELTEETLSPVPELFKECLSELRIRCNYFKRGCKEYIQLGDLTVHVKNCGFAPIICSNEGCRVEINIRDQRHHESEVCEFRKLKCHDCEEIKKEMEEIKQDLQAMKINDKEVAEKLDRNGMAVKGAMEEMKEELTKINEVQKKLMREIEGNIRGMNTRVVIVGGSKTDGKLLSSVEMFEWPTMSWIPLREMKQKREAASSVVYNNEIIVNGRLSDLGKVNDIEKLSIKSNMYNEVWSDFPTKLPVKLSYHSSVVYKDRLIVVGGYDDNKVVCDGIEEVVLVQPYTTRKLTRMQQARCCHGAQLYDDKILICGGMTEWSKFDSAVDSVEIYDISKNEIKQMQPLPYPVIAMATVKWGENILVIGGVGKDRKVLKSVIIYNVKTENYHFLPDMKNKRVGCVAVVVKNNIVVMGGRDEKYNYLKSVEKFSFDNYKWEDLPPMNEARCWATAVVC